MVPPVRKRRGKTTVGEGRARKAAERKREREGRNAMFREDGWDPTVLAFTNSPGPKKEACTLKSESEPIEFLNLFLTDELLDVLVTETNRYAVQCITQEARREEAKRVQAEVYSLYPYLVVFYSFDSLVQYLSI